jgi:YceI-like domain
MFRAATIGLLLSIGIPATAQAGPTAAIIVDVVGCTLEIDGDSTLHRYSSTSHSCQAAFDVNDADGVAPPPGDLNALIKGGHVKRFSLVVPVATLKSGDSHLDDHLWKALKQTQFKQIRFDMDSYRLLPPAAGADAFVIAMHGRLRVAGVSRPIDLTATAKTTAGGLQISGAKNLLMTDYQVTPPTLFLGTVKTADLITIKFNSELRAAAH